MLFAHYTRRAHVSGILVPSSGLLTLNANLSGSVSRVWVRVGESVHAGQSLVTLSGDADSSAIGNVHADITRRLRTQQRLLVSDRDALHASIAARQRELERQLALYRVQRRQVRAQLALQKKHTTNDLQLLHRIEPLGEKGYVSAIQIEQQRSQVLEDRLQARELSQRALALAQKISSTQKNLVLVPLDGTRQDNDISRKLDTIGQRLAQNEAQRSVVLRAPSSGIVSSMLVVPGQDVRAGAKLLNIVPAHSSLQAQLLVPSQAIGFVDAGSRVVLRYRAYPYQKFGQQFGRVSLISHNPLGPADIFELTGQRTDQPLYRVKVRLDRQTVLVYGKTRALKPGMTLDADILMDRRSLLEWVFEPLYGMSRRVNSRELSDG